MDANQPLSGQKPPPTGEITPSTSPLAGKKLQSLEKSGRKPANQWEYSSTYWRNTDANATVRGKISPSSGEIRTLKALAGSR